MKRVLHITADHPDAYSARKTEAVRNLIEGATAFEHHVYSINRRDGFGGITMLDRRGHVCTLVYRAPAYGILLETFLKRLAHWIIEDIRRLDIQVDLVHAHKLTIEGLAARRVAAALGCPYICTIRGNTDQKYIRLKPEKRLAYRCVASDASALLPGTPWCERYVVRTLSVHDTALVVLPTITTIDEFIAPLEEGRRFVTAFHLDGWRLKGMPNLLAAIARLRREQLDITLDIIGGGSEKATKALEREIRRHGLLDSVTMCGPVPHDQMPRAFNSFAAFVLPTLRESFGMVYIEALFSGVPILYSQERGIDGYFDDQDVGVRCDPRSVASIARGLAELRSGVPRMKKNISRLQKEGGFERFRKRNICRVYENVVEEVCGEESALRKPASTTFSVQQ